jgi:hypothetical protein
MCPVDLELNSRTPKVSFSAIADGSLQGNSVCRIALVCLWLSFLPAGNPQCLHKGNESAMVTGTAAHRIAKQHEALEIEALNRGETKTRPPTHAALNSHSDLLRPRGKRKRGLSFKAASSQTLKLILGESHLVRITNEKPSRWGGVNCTELWDSSAGKLFEPPLALSGF